MQPRVMIFEDDEFIRKLLSAICEKRGYQVTAYADPGLCPLHAEARCPCRTEEVCAEAIITDLQMPLVRGLDFVEALLNKGCHCRNIALVSGSCDEADLARAARLGCKVIAKPFKAAEIKDWLEQVEHSLPANRNAA